MQGEPGPLAPGLIIDVRPTVPGS